MPPMKPFTERAAEALEQLPEEMREPMVSYIFEQAEKYRTMKQLVDEGIADVEAGKVADWDFEDFLLEARAHKR